MLHILCFCQYCKSPGWRQKVIFVPLFNNIPLLRFYCCFFFLNTDPVEQSTGRNGGFKTTTANRKCWCGHKLQMQHCLCFCRSILLAFATWSWSFSCYLPVLTTDRWTDTLLMSRSKILMHILAALSWSFLKYRLAIMQKPVELWSLSFNGHIFIFVQLVLAKSPGLAIMWCILTALWAWSWNIIIPCVCVKTNCPIHLLHLTGYSCAHQNPYFDPEQNHKKVIKFQKRIIGIFNGC